MRNTLLILTIAAATAQAQVDPNRVIVTVNGAPIVGRDYYRRMETQPGLGTPTTDMKFVQVYPGYLTLRFLIEEELIVQLAKSQGVAPTDAQVDAELAAKKLRNPEQFNSLAQFGMAEQEMKRRILVDMSEFNVLTKGVTITDFEVEKYYKDNPTKFRLPKRYQLRMIRVGSEDAKKDVDAALAGGEKFEDVAARLSNDMTKLDGGRLGIFAEEDMLPATRTVISATAKGKVSAWIEQNSQFAKFLVEDILQETIIPLDEGLKAAIREQLMTERGQARNNLPQMMQDFRKKAVLEFGDYPFKEEIKRHFEIGG
jgi:parvulin-like peptidyl-prolyl isomerase